jgi:hypothetical protein
MTVVPPIGWRIARRAGQPVSRVPHGRRSFFKTNLTQPVSWDFRFDFPSTGTIRLTSFAYNAPYRAAQNVTEGGNVAPFKM